MTRLIKQINNTTRIEFDKGTFDDWCVYLSKPIERRYAPLDTEYFERLQVLGRKYTTQKIYSDFIKFYTLTDKNISQVILRLIDAIAKEYPADELEINIWFTVIYAGMIAEENKANAILKKRVKRLGMHQVLIQNHTPAYAANFSKGKKWRDLDVIMEAHGF
ncbi:MULTISPECIES: hypothetical protein [unclassified Pedobacter]|uniref:DUF7004 family protein n=1 Tax=unclassified Pedobacter TaxID=2628915 RepID=UPI001E3B01EC|nr:MULTISPECIES: hypothetical protein [unclassified Pedobacter]